jgi:hypothetical protein
MWRISLPLWRSARYRLRVVGVVRESSDVVSVYLSGSRPQVRQSCAAFAESLCGNTQRAAVRCDGQRERIGPGPSRTAEEPDVEELPRPRRQPI